MYTYTLEDLEELSKMTFVSAEQCDRARKRAAAKKEIERLEIRLARLIEKKHKMLFCAGIVDADGKRMPMAEERADRIRQRLLRTKAWMGNEYEIEMAKADIKHWKDELGE